jgi:hypothetical protein
MSLTLDNTETEINNTELLRIIAQNLILMNARLEEAFETGIEIEDVDDGNY